MDSRQEPRFAADQPVTVTNLGAACSSVAATIVNFSARGLRLCLCEELPVGSLVKVEWGTTLLLGQIIYCKPEGEAYSAGMELEEAVYDTRLFTSEGGARADVTPPSKTSRQVTGGGYCGP